MWFCMWLWLCLFLQMEFTVSRVLWCCLTQTYMAMWVCTALCRLLLSTPCWDGVVFWQSPFWWLSFKAPADRKQWEGCTPRLLSWAGLSSMPWSVMCKLALYLALPLCLSILPVVRPIFLVCLPSFLQQVLTRKLCLGLASPLQYVQACWKAE